MLLTLDYTLILDDLESNFNSDFSIDDSDEDSGEYFFTSSSFLALFLI